MITIANVPTFPAVLLIDYIWPDSFPGAYPVIPTMNRTKP